MGRRRCRPGFAAALALLMATATAGCGAQRQPASREVSSPPALPVEAVDDLEPASLALAAERTVAALEAGSGTSRLRAGAMTLSSADLVQSARRIAAVARSESTPAGLTRRLLSECRTARVAEPAKVTSYYEPVLAARKQPDRRFRYPLYRAPSASQMATLRRRLGRVPTRADIDRRHVLGAKGLELAWVDDAVARFFLHVQGSGRLVFGDGSEQRVGFAATNDLPYRSIGALMIGKGILAPDRASAPAMRSWLTAHSSRRDAILEHNPRYVFFREYAGDGPIGALGAALVAGRSIAVDERFVPRGMFAWLSTTTPVVDREGLVLARRPLTRFVVAQDAGAAIRGAGRIDLFAGSGEEAGREAGVMNEKGELFLLLCDSVPSARK